MSFPKKPCNNSVSIRLLAFPYKVEDHEKDEKKKKKSHKANAMALTTTNKGVIKNVIPYSDARSIFDLNRQYRELSGLAVVPTSKGTRVHSIASNSYLGAFSNRFPVKRKLSMIESSDKPLLIKNPKIVQSRPLPPVGNRSGTEVQVQFADVHGENNGHQLTESKPKPKKSSESETKTPPRVETAQQTDMTAIPENIILQKVESPIIGKTITNVQAKKSEKLIKHISNLRISLKTLYVRDRDKSSYESEEQIKPPLAPKLPFLDDKDIQNMIERISRPTTPKKQRQPKKKEVPLKTKDFFKLRSRFKKYKRTPRDRSKAKDELLPKLEKKKNPDSESHPHSSSDTTTSSSDDEMHRNAFEVGRKENSYKLSNKMCTTVTETMIRKRKAIKGCMTRDEWIESSAGKQSRYTRTTAGTLGLYVPRLPIQRIIKTPTQLLTVQGVAKELHNKKPAEPKKTALPFQLLGTKPNKRSPSSSSVDNRDESAVRKSPPAKSPIRPPNQRQLHKPCRQQNPQNQQNQQNPQPKSPAPRKILPPKQIPKTTKNQKQPKSPKGAQPSLDPEVDWIPVRDVPENGAAPSNGQTDADHRSIVSAPEYRRKKKLNKRRHHTPGLTKVSTEMRLLDNLRNVQRETYAKLFEIHRREKECRESADQKVVKVIYEAKSKIPKTVPANEDDLSEAELLD